MATNRHPLIALVLTTLAAISCEQSANKFGDRDGAVDFAGSGGTSGSGGTTGSGGAIASGGATGSGGAIASGGATGSGGAIASGGATGSGGGGAGRGGSAGRGTGGIATGSGGGAGRGTGGAGGAGGASQCPPGQIWCPGCTVGTGLCSTGGCPAIACAPCSQNTTRAACDAQVNCHPVFTDPNTCGCALPGCCAQFSRCAEGDRAVCGTLGISCTTVTPYCDGPYVNEWTGGCSSGCVDSKDCGACDPSWEAPVINPGVCDGRGEGLCQTWAQHNTLAGTGTPNARCVGSGATSTCARANRCDSTTDPAGCFCGNGPACAPGQACVTPLSGGTPVCRCAVRNG